MGPARGSHEPTPESSRKLLKIPPKLGSRNHLHKLRRGQHPSLPRPTFFFKICYCSNESFRSVSTLSLPKLQTSMDRVTELAEEKQESAVAVPTFLRSLEEPQRSIDPASRGARVAGEREVLVWWDIESTCPIDGGVAASSLFQEFRRRTSAVDELCVTMNVYGNAGPDAKAALDALVAGGVALQHRILPCKQPGSESAAVTTMVVDMALWALATPAPADVFVVSAGRGAALRELVCGLQLRDYTIHLATTFKLGKEQLFRPMPRHWSASKQLFAARIVTSPPPSSVQIPEQLALLHLHS